ncbi:BZ3500_MvSof-1268-A1-R1_Chr6-2g08448 [Microbotryum saponariae]|uniref:BZ3500_MvSof-1268-A1-R1_Chr6-2g08448 protein n=1 Tax=Microbotryum saponariae TaxID=289078 RepID=A0A2X0KI71_9BASI|nr:BZ3500_MvSof-1268-A1-R1_Chr6-2g08448 [Microbotryum saponariae]SDA07725.1 BZ3501_MvSof-1269-A2-R1_Chr6-1g08162 [Microbotryum saponariae]
MAAAATPSSIPALKRALLQIHHSHPRLIAAPPVVPGSPASGASRRASVAIIIRLRPAGGSPSPTASGSPTSTAAPSPAPASPFASAGLPLHASPPGSPPTGAHSASIPLPTSGSLAPKSIADQLDDFFSQKWVHAPGTTAEILYIKRATRSTDKWSGHVAFPGGRQEPEDEDGRYTAMRESWEEVGLDLAEKEWIPVGALDDREITTSLGKRLLMILSCYVFLHTSPHAPIPELQESEVASAHWVPLEQLTAPQAKVGVVSIDISTRLAPRNALARIFLKALVGSMNFKCILLPNHPVALGLHTPVLPSHPLPDLKLWGLTLGMTLDLLTHMNPASSALSSGDSTDLSTYPHLASTLPGTQQEIEEHPFAPSAASIFPRFSYPDINLLIYVFGFRYRRILRYRPSAPGENARVNWAGMTLGSYYSAVRRALVVAVVLRGCAALGAVAYVLTLVRRKVKARIVGKVLS